VTALAENRFPRDNIPGERFMDQLILFCLFGGSALMAWFGQRGVAIGVFFAAIALTAADYLHHATDALNLSF
jgi:hypothetical protein